MVETKAKQHKKVNKKRIAFILFCCVVPVVQWLVFYIYGNASSFIMAFTNKNGEFSLDNFVRFWYAISDPEGELRLAARNTFMTFGILVVVFPFRVMVAYFIYKKVPGYWLYRILFFLPNIIFSVALAMIFTRMIGVNGFIAKWVQDLLSLDSVPELIADSRYANTVVILHMLWLGFPGDLIVWGGTFARIPTEVLESAEVDGINWWQEFTQITIPLVWPTFALKTVLMFCGVFGATGAVFLLTEGDYGTMTLATWLYKQLLQGSGSQYNSNVFNYLSAVGLVMTIIAVGISLVIRKWTDKVFDDVEY